jgi:hypothetical protein
MKKKRNIIALIFVYLMLILLSTNVVSQEDRTDNTIINKTSSMVFYAHVHIELDVNSTQAHTIKDHSITIPNWKVLLLQNLTIDEPNVDENSELIIIPIYQAIFSQRTGIGKILRFAPDECTVIFINLFWGMIEERETTNGEVLVVDGFAPFLIWRNIDEGE